MLLFLISTQSNALQVMLSLSIIFFRKFSQLIHCYPTKALMNFLNKELIWIVNLIASVRDLLVLDQTISMLVTAPAKQIYKNGTY